MIGEIVTCAKCQRPVEKMVRSDMQRTHEIVFTVHCHGETEVTRVPEHLLMAKVEGGVAFERYALPEGQLRIEA